MQGDASNRSTPGRDRSRPINRRRQSNPTPTNRPHAQPPTSPPSHGYHATSHQRPSDEISIATNITFQSPPLHFSPIHPFPPTGFYGQYTAPSQPSMGMGQSHHFSYPPPFHSPPITDPNMNIGPPNIQASYPAMAQPHTSMYQFQRHPSDDGSNTTTTSPFGAHPTGLNPAHTQISTSSGQMSPSYLGGSPFGPIRYSSPMGTPPYNYPQQYTSTPPLYQAFSAYPPAPPPSSSEMDSQPQGAWYYVGQSQPSTLQHRYEGGQYPSNYPVQYPSLARPQEHGRFGPSPGTSQNTPQPFSQRQRPDAEPPISSPSPPARPSTAGASSSSSSAPASLAGPKHLHRREWHPRPPPQRSPWVMWVGNVPQDATQEELWTFFTRSPVGSSSDIDGAASGVQSIFLITRSNCAFVNYNSERALEAAMQAFNGLRLRPNDPQCPMLVCKIRHATDDLKSGVGGQRGIGLHKQWIKDQRKLRGQGSDASSVSDDISSLASALRSVSMSSDEDLGRTAKGKQSSSSESYASTTSSLLADHFPTRYFILKSLSEYDLDLSVQNELWATQKHNELVLDRAFRTAQDVFLIFSVNKSGEFYGYARMAGPIRQGEGSVSWASRSDTSFSSRLSPPVSSPSSPQAPAKAPSDSRLLNPPSSHLYFTPGSGHQVDSSPISVEPSPEQGEAAVMGSPDHHRQKHEPHSAPGHLGGPHVMAERTPSIKFSLDHHERRQGKRPAPSSAFRLDPSAPFRAMRGRQDGLESPEGSRALGSVEEAQEDQEHEDNPEEESIKQAASTWGECFKIEWIERTKVPFHRTRHLRNAWNKGREIKISRDGTELEPSVGRRLLEEWKKLADG